MMTVDLERSEGFFSKSQLKNSAKYSRSSLHLARDRNRKGRFRSKNRKPKKLEEARLINIFFKCSNKWLKGHRRPLAAVINHVRAYFSE